MKTQNQTNLLGFPAIANFSGIGKQFPQDRISLCQQLLDEQGFFLLKELPDDFEVGRFLENFGNLIPQHEGEYVYSVKFAVGFENYSDSKSTNSLTPHTDGSDFAIPPHWMALFGVQPATCGGGQTLLADGYQFISSLDSHTQEQLRTRIYSFKSSKGIHSKRTHAVESPLLSNLPEVNRPIFRFSQNLLLHGDYSAPINHAAIEADFFTQKVCEQLATFFNTHYISILINCNDLLVWDNWRMIHSRTQYCDPTRHLLRYWISHGHTP